MVFWLWKLFKHYSEIIFNEIAPRPHNSFHWTIEGCVTSQFAQLVRIISGLGAGDTTARGTWQMDNLLVRICIAWAAFMLTGAGLFICMAGRRPAGPQNGPCNLAAGVSGAFRCCLPFSPRY